MSTIEKQWLQIFERQRWVINQAKQQAFLFDQDLASKLIIAGITPPPSLFSSDPDVVNQHELISEVPFPRTWRVIPFTGIDFCGFDKPVATGHYRQVTNGLSAEHCGVNKDFDVGRNVLDLPHFPISDAGCASNGVFQDHQEEDPSVTSPEDERNVLVSDAYQDSALQLARDAGKEVSALPQGHIRDSGGASSGVLQDQREEKPGGTYPGGQRDAVYTPKVSNGGCASNGVNQEHREDDPTVKSPEDERDARVSKVYHDSAFRPVRGTGEGVSVSPQCHISDAGCAFEGVIIDHKEENPGCTSPESQRDVQMVCLPVISNGGFASNGVTQDHREDPSVTSPEDEMDAKVADVHHDSALTPARGTGEGVSVSSQCHITDISDAGCACDGVVQDHNEENPGHMSPEDKRDAIMLDIYLDSALSLARVQRSKSRQRALAIRNSAQKSFSQDKDNVDGYAGETIKCLISTPQSEYVDELNENHSVVDKPKMGELQSKEKGSRSYSGRITRSKSSAHLENSVNASSSLCISKTSDGIAVDSTGKSKQLSNHVIHPLEFVSFSHITNGNCREEELVSADCLSMEEPIVEKDYMSANLKREEYTPKAVQEVTGHSISKHDAGNSIVCRSPVEGTHLNEDHQMIGTSGSSPEAQRKEGGMSLEWVDTSPNAPFTYLHEVNEPSFSSMIQQAAGHCHDSLLEETRAPHPTRISIDGGSHGVKENPVALLRDNLRIETTEDLSFAGKTLQAKRSDFGGPRKSSELSDSAPHVTSLQYENVAELNDNQSKVVEQKIGEVQIKEEGTVMHSGRMTRSRSSGRQKASLIASSSAYIGRTNSGMAEDVNTMEQSCSKGLSTLASKKGIQGSSSVKMPLSFMPVEKILEEGMTIPAHGNCDSTLETNFLGNCEVSAEEVEVQSSLVEGVEDQFSESIRLSNDNAISSVKDPCDAYTEAIVNTFLESGKTLKHKCFLQDDQTPLPVGWGNLVHSLVKEVSGSKAAKPGLVLDECAMDFNALCDSHKSTDVDHAVVFGSGSPRILDAVNLELENPYATSRDELRSNLAQSTLNAHISPGYLHNASEDREVGFSEPTEGQTADNSKGRSICYSMDDISPNLKRRKIEDKRVHDLSTSVALREEVLHSFKKDSICANLEREEQSPTALQQVQGRSISQEAAVSRTHAEERHLNGDHMVDSSPSLCHAQKLEGGMGLEGVDISPNAPFTFLHEEKEASVFSRLIMQAVGDPQASLLEEAGVPLPSSINTDCGGHCLKEDPPYLPLQDDLRLEHAEDVSYAGRTLLAKRFDFGGTSKFTELSGSAPHAKSMDLTIADDAMPVLEGFVIRTDDDPHSIAKEGMSFEEWNLPNSAVERASILQQLCKSACMQTPVAYSSASYKLHKVQTLRQSVPTGVVEHVDMRTTFPFNDNVKQSKDGNSCWTEEVGPAFYERSYSDCQPIHSGQSGWDNKKLYSSPVGKFWNRIASSSSSSGKRVSSIPELACISEENENTDELADTFQDGIVSEMLGCSPKRPPLADITEIPNLPASFSKALPHTDRFSIDSVNTEFSFTGTHKSIKKKPGIQNSTRRRYNNKENQSISRGTKDIKRPSGSLQNSYSKPKLSERANLRKGGPSLAELEPKRNNIVSNITSFIPLVQQKQAAAALPGKRDIKVKALEAAEAAKRLAERKDNERKKKKEAMKVERARVEQENLKKLELQRKMKEEERKKIEADMAAKKRQRDDEDKKEKQMKRMRVEERRREQREHEEKTRAEKVKKRLKCQASDGRGFKIKEPKHNTLHKKMDEEIEHDTLRSISETDPRSSCVSANNARGTAVHEEYNKGFTDVELKEEVQGNSDKHTENEKLVVKTSREQSYDISPYKESDDEDEEEDDNLPNNKFIPSWASKNCLSLVAPRQNGIDPEGIFCPESFPCVSEVLLL
ncbi:uncharacterized protein LOC126803471 [Argentina anserina]|uniref:uncharacterized protein LOC126803471 n=1 Tax=Argentina anserina TaxID=57926 RepID=UPI002176865A|nr:uncharacterized protein LOC126803471 [Potentilla anserina]